jgi:hypothetical protein
VKELIIGLGPRTFPPAIDIGFSWARGEHGRHQGFGAIFPSPIRNGSGHASSPRGNSGL